MASASIEEAPVKAKPTILATAMPALAKQAAAHRLASRADSCVGRGVHARKPSRYLTRPAAGPRGPLLGGAAPGAGQVVALGNVVAGSAVVVLGLCVADDAGPQLQLAAATHDD